MRSWSLAALAIVAFGCGSAKPPPKAAEPAAQQKEETAPLVVQQEFGSIDDRAVEHTFKEQQDALETCHTQGRERVEYLAGDVKVFLRIDKDGKVRYGYFEESSLGDRDTEKCILDVLSHASWPQPIGGEAEVRHTLGWDAGQERQPSAWDADNVTQAIAANATVKRNVEQCKRGAKGDFHVTAYVGTPDPSASPGKTNKKSGAKKDPKKAGKKGQKARFLALGVAAADKDTAAKADCIVDALKDLALPSPGSFAAKVAFAL